MDAWKKLIRVYKKKKRICNCGEAYYNSNGECQYGCSANLIRAKEYIARCVLKDLWFLAGKNGKGYD